MHKPMPAYRASRNLWYLEIEGRQVPLGKHPDGLPEPKKTKTKGGARGEWNPPEEILRLDYQTMIDPSTKTCCQPPSRNRANRPWPRSSTSFSAG